MRHRRISLFLVVSLIFSLAFPAFAVGGEPYDDLSDHWAREFIVQAAQRQLFEDSGGHFRPDEPMSRAAFIALLWRASGCPKASAPSDFVDLGDTPHRAAIDWAWETGVVIGIGEGWLDPDRAVTREEAAVMLHRMAGCPQGMEAMFTGIYDGLFEDVTDLSTWAKSAVYWSIFQELYCGTDSAAPTYQLAPKAAAARGQIAVMLVRYLDQN